MKTRLVIAALCVATMAVLVEAQRGDADRMLFEAAKKIESVDGDPLRAIEQYKKLTNSQDRELARQVLLRIAEAYRKLGRESEATATYERVAREYGQAAPAATAVAQRGDSREANRDLRLRKVFDGAFTGAVSPDGRYLVHHRGLSANAVILRNLSTGVERTLDSGRFFENATFSHDGTRVAYGQCGDTSVCEVRTVVLREDKPAPRRIYATEGAFVAPIDWSPDGTLIAVYVQRRAEQALQLGLLRVSDGTLQVLHSMAWGGTLSGFFSRDGRDVAYSRRMDEDAGARDVFLIDVDGKRQIALVTNAGDDFPLGWSPDGRHLLFASDRNGSIGVWSQAVADRRPVGQPTLVQANLGGDVGSMGVTRTGTLFVGIRTFSQDVEVASFDAASGKAAVAPVQVRSAADRTWLPAWSPDGQFLAYVLVRNGTESTIGIRAMATGDERELRLANYVDRVRSLTWAPDGRSLVGWGRDLRGRYGIFRIDSTSGTVAPIVFRDPPLVRQFFWSPDGQNLRYIAQGAAYEHDGQEERRIELLDGRPGMLSPDGRWIARLTRDNASRVTTVLVQSISGGDPRELHRFDPPAQVLDFRWARDGRTLSLIHERGDGEKDVLMVPIDGPAPRRLDFNVDRLSKNLAAFVELSPDRRRLAYVVGDDRQEVWALENFLPLN